MSHYTVYIEYGHLNWSL